MGLGLGGIIIKKKKFKPPGALENGRTSDSNGEKQRNTNLGGDRRLGRFGNVLMEVINTSSV